MAPLVLLQGTNSKTKQIRSDSSELAFSINEKADGMPVRRRWERDVNTLVLKGLCVLDRAVRQGLLS